MIVLDPGHGGVDGGAIGPGGAVEKTIVFDYAPSSSSRLEASEQFKVVMTRNGDEFVSLDDRVQIARDANAALLISIHADTLQAPADVSGATVYTCLRSGFGRRGGADRRARKRRRQGRRRRIRGRKTAGVADILFDLKRRETRAYAHMFSRGLVDAMARGGTPQS